MDLFSERLNIHRHTHGHPSEVDVDCIRTAFTFCFCLARVGSRVHSCSESNYPYHWPLLSDLRIPLRCDWLSRLLARYRPVDKINARSFCRRAWELRRPSAAVRLLCATGAARRADRRGSIVTGGSHRSAPTSPRGQPKFTE